MSIYDGKNTQNPVTEDKRYQGRTNFFHTEFNKGNVSLYLKDVMVSDKGKYTCSVFFENWYDEVVVELQVAAIGDESSVSLDGHVGQSIGLTCKSQGWFPEPIVVWLDSKREIRKEKATTQNVKTSSGIFDVISSMNLEPRSDMEVSCRVVNDLLNTARESRVLISDAFFPSTSPWMTAFLVILFLTVAVIAAIAYKLKSNSKRTLDAKKMKENKEEDGYKVELVPITVNPDSQHLELRVSGVLDTKSNNTSESAALSAASTVPVLVGQEGFAAGKHYWEVEVEQHQDWVLGVVREKWKQEEGGILPMEDYWALHRSQGELFSSEGDIKIGKKKLHYSVIGVLLDLEERQVKFYEAEQMVLLVAIPISLGKEAAKTYYPFVPKREGTLKPFVLRPVRIPVPLKLYEQVCEIKRIRESQFRQLQAQLGQIQGQLDRLQKEHAQVKEEKGKVSSCELSLAQVAGDKASFSHPLIASFIHFPTEFLKIQRHKVDVSLDADTAHPRLEVSQDGKSVKDTGTARSVPRTEKRFDSHTFLLAKEGYTSGKCYWEVDVGKRRNWDVGIAREPVTRKGTLTLSPEKGFWVIGLADGKDYWARTEPWTRLVVSGKPRKIGIFLDVSAKKLSFFNVSKKTAVYTFTLGGDSSQGGKFFPFFSTGSTSAKPDTEPLKIVLGFEEDHDDE
ncbi:butyrophilin subfamily 2 member A2-like [Apteryx mantelli]|uniref:Butyrophilin subfamily 2 member A2-like n=1 Tax=Apteryx mantelli TaxID=2696672 RepID=A0ABM4FZH9_9AVES